MAKAIEKKAIKPVKCIVRRGFTFHSARELNGEPGRGYDQGDIVTIDGNAMVIGENLRQLTAEELRLKPSELRKIELGEDERPADEEMAIDEAA